MAMKASQIQSHSGTEALKLIASSNDSNLNWRGIVLFVLYTSVVLCFLLFSGDGNYRSVDGPAPRLSYNEVAAAETKNGGHLGYRVLLTSTKCMQPDYRVNAARITRGVTIYETRVYLS